MANFVIKYPSLKRWSSIDKPQKVASVITLPVSYRYHRHAYKLGEHYNSVVPKSEENDSEEEFS